MILCGCTGPTCCKEKTYKDPGEDGTDPEYHGHELQTLDPCATLNGGNYDCACYYVINNPPPPAKQDPTLPKPHGRKMKAADRAAYKAKGLVISIECIRTVKKDPSKPLAARGHHSGRKTGEHLA